MRDHLALHRIQPSNTHGGKMGALSSLISLPLLPAVVITVKYFAIWLHLTTQIPGYLSDGIFDLYRPLVKFTEGDKVQLLLTCIKHPIK